MSDPVIARNRFGLGARPGEPAPADGKRWLLDQLGCFQPRPAAIAALPGQEAAAQAIMDYQQAARAARLQRREAKTAAPAMTATPAAPAAPAAPESAQPDRTARREARADIRRFQVEAVAARANAALASDTPFVERLVHFWSNHFAVSAEKPPVAALAGGFEFDAIRPHVLGRFGDMLGAVERHPAMLIYLDQAQSVGPASPAGRRAARNGRKRGLNENLAREIMELHTLGVRTGYGQGDVTELARALTGWTVAGIGGAGRRLGRRAAPGEFLFARQVHEPGARTILGRSFPQGGEEQAEAALATLATHPATARHVATKLARHFVADAPPAPLVLRLESAFVSSGGDLPTVYRTLIDSPEAWTPAPAKFKTPWEWAISAARAIGAETFPAPNAAGFVGQLGQRVWRPGSPAGFDDVAAGWAGPDALMRRVEAAERLAGRARLQQDARRTAEALFGPTLTRATAEAIGRAESPAQGVALLLVSPEFLRR